MLPPAHAISNTVQSFPPPGSVGPGPLIWDVYRGPLLPPRGTKERDRILRIFDNQDYNGLWQGARSGILKKLSAIPYEINGPAAKAQYYHDILGQAHFGHGWEYLIKLCLRDFLTQSYGAIFEIAGPGDPTQPLLEAPTAINHLDAGRCYVTGNPIYPILYYSLWDGKLHRMHASRVYMMVDDPIPDERYFGIGTSALERAISVVQREIRMGEYVDALLDDKPQPGILSLTGVSDANMQAKILKYQQEQQNDERPVFGRTIILTSLDPNAAVKAEVIPFSQTPEKFDFIKYTDLDVNALALSLGVDRQELWELAGRGLGSGSQSETLAIKSRAKLYGDWLAGVERFMNWAILPDDCEFTFKEKDEQADQMQAAIDLQYAQIAQTLITAGFDKAVVAKLLASKSETFKDAFTNDLGQISYPSGDVQTPAQLHQDAALDSSTPAPDKLIGAPQPQAPAQLPAGTTKAFGATASDFQNKFTYIVTRLALKQLRRTDAENMLLGLLLSSGEKAFADGLAQGGVTDALDDDEQAQVQDRVADAIDYLDPLLDAATDGSLPVEQISARAEMWVNKTLTGFYNAGRISADKNGYYIWKLGKTEKHCPDCARLNGQVHRFKEWYVRGWIPQSDKLACGGYRCDCRLDKAQGPGSGRF